MSPPKILDHNLKTHRRLDGIFREHQGSLLERDFARARVRLSEYEKSLRAHIDEEESRFLPIYSRSEEARRLPASFFSGEHKRMRELLGRIRRAAARLKKGGIWKRPLIALLDLESHYKLLVRHHDERERNLLYPALDRWATNEEKKFLLKSARRAQG